MIKLLKAFLSINSATITIGAILVSTSLFLSGVPILDMIELKTYDLRFRSRGNLKPLPAVVLALIDEKSLDTEGRWPWPRSKIASLVDILSRDGAKVIGFDVGFLEPDENSRLSLLKQLGREVEKLGIDNPKLGDFIQQSQVAADNDLALATAIKNASATVVLGYFWHMSETDLDYKILPGQIERQLDRISGSKYPLVMDSRSKKGIDPFITAFMPESNLTIFSQAAAASGYYSVKADPDGVVRWLPLIIEFGDELFPPLSVLCVWYFLDRPQMVVNLTEYGVEGIQMGPRFIPTDEGGEMLINYLGPAKTFPHVSISDILSGRVSAGTFKDKIVLVGATAMGIHDLRATPLSPLYPGVEIHATVIDNILTGNFITRPKWSKIYDVFAIIILGTLTGIALPRMSAFKGLCFAVGLFAVHIFVARWLFVHHRVWLNMVFPLLVLMLNYTALTAFYYVTEERERKKVKGTFKQFVAPLGDR